MSSKKWLALSLIAAFTLSLIAAGCGGNSGGGKPAAAKYVRYVAGPEPDTLDPRKSNGMPEARMEANLFEGLMTHGKDGAVVPGVAEKHTVSPDGKVYTFTLRSGLKWSNGDPVTAQDFEYAWKKTLDPAFASKYAQQLYFLKGAFEYNTNKGPLDEVGVKATDDKTLVVTLAEPTPFFLSVLVHHSFYPVNKKVDEANPKWMNDAKTFVGNGAFMMQSWAHNGKIECVKNPNYWDAANVKMEKLDFILSENANTNLSLFESGQADFVDSLPPAELPRLLKENKVVALPILGNGFYVFNVTKKPFDDPKLRKAFALAIDREALVKTLNNGWTPAYAFVPPGIADAEKGSDYSKVGGNLFKADVAEAKKLLAEAGFPDGKGLPTIPLIYNTNETNKLIAEALQEMWSKNLGVKVELQNQEWKVFLQSRSSGNYTLARHAWIGDYEDPTTFLNLYESTSGNNDAKYKDAKFDADLRKSYAIADPKERMKLFHEMEKKLIAEDMAAIPLYFLKQYVMAKPGVKDYVTTSIGLTYFKYASVQ